MRFDILTMHPQMCGGPLSTSILGRAQASGVIDVHIQDIRQFGLGRYNQVDDEPYGGGSGMVMRIDVLHKALLSVRTPDSWVIMTDPGGKQFKHTDAVRLSKKDHIIFICGHYEGIDARVFEFVDESLSIGDYVLTGGELPAMVMLDAVARMAPGVLGNPKSLEKESFTDGLLEAPSYTRPREYAGFGVPEVLLSGHHQNISDWRHAESIERTRELRPDLHQMWLDKKVKTK